MSHQKFFSFIKSRSIYIDYQYIWDLISNYTFNESGGINLLIFEQNTSKSRNRINIVCPLFNNFDIKKKTLLLYCKDNLYEPIFLFKKQTTIRSSNLKEIIPLLTFEELNEHIPSFKTLSKNIKECKLKNTNEKVNFDNLTLIKKIMKQKGKLFKKINIEQYVNFDSKVVGLFIQTDSNPYIYLPCFPSKIIMNKHIPFTYDFKYINDFKITHKSLTFWGNNGILCNPVIILTDDKNAMGYGIITETNQMVPIKEIEITEIPPILIRRNTFRYNNYNSNDVLNNNALIINKTIDNDRLINTKKIKLDYYFYVLFRNILKKILIEKSKFKKEIEKIFDDYNLIYNEKLEKLYKFLKIIMNDYVNFAEFVVDDITKLSNCLDIDNKNCFENQQCMLNDKKNCKTTFPVKSFLNETSNNEKKYYIKISDEILRYPIIREYILFTHRYLSFDNPEYNIDDNQLIIVASNQNELSEYFKTINIIQKKNKFIKSNNMYDIMKNNKDLSTTNYYLKNIFFHENIETNILNKDIILSDELIQEYKLNIKEPEELFHIIQFEKVYDNLKETINLNTWRIMLLINENYKEQDKIMKIEDLKITLQKNHKLLKSDIFKKGHGIDISKKTNILLKYPNGLEYFNKINEFNYSISICDIYIFSYVNKISIILINMSTPKEYFYFKNNNFGTNKTFVIIYNLINLEDGDSSDEEGSLDDSNKDNICHNLKSPIYGVLMRENKIYFSNWELSNYFSNIIEKSDENYKMEKTFIGTNGLINLLKLNNVMNCIDKNITVNKLNELTFAKSSIKKKRKKNKKGMEEKQEKNPTPPPPTRTILKPLSSDDDSFGSEEEDEEEDEKLEKKPTED